MFTIFKCLSIKYIKRFNNDLILLYKIKRCIELINFLADNTLINTIYR